MHAMVVEPERVGRNTDAQGNDKECREVGLGGSQPETSQSVTAAKRGRRRKLQVSDLKSVDADEQLKTREANAEAYKSLSDEELIKVIPVRKDGTPSSLGAILHAAGKCSPCIFCEDEGGCKFKIRCHFCHLEHPENSRRVKRKKLLAAGHSEKASMNEDEGQSPGAGSAHGTAPSGLPKRTNDQRDQAQTKEAKHGPNDQRVANRITDQEAKHLRLDSRGCSRPIWLQPGGLGDAPILYHAPCSVPHAGPGSGGAFLWRVLL